MESEIEIIDETNHEMLKKKVGRPAKQIMTQDEQEDEIIVKWLNHEPLTLDETATAIWMMEGRVGKPMSFVGIQKMEKRALDKLKAKLEAHGYKFSDFVNVSGRRSATILSKFQAPEED